MEFIIKKQNVEILSFNDFVKEITNSHLKYIKRQISSNDYKRLQTAIENEDIVECVAITKSWHIDLDNIHSGRFRDGLITFTKMADGSYKIRTNDADITFNNTQVLFILEDKSVIPINLWQRDLLIDIKKENIANSLEGCPFNYCDRDPKCEGKCRYQITKP